MNIKYTVRITRLLELRCCERDRPLNFAMGRTNLGPIYNVCGFYSILESIQGPNPKPTGPYTLKVTKHSPSDWCIYSKFAYGEVKDPLRLYRGKDCLKKFCDYIRQEANRLCHMFLEKPMDLLTPKQMKKYNKASRCHICFK